MPNCHPSGHAKQVRKLTTSTPIPSVFSDSPPDQPCPTKQHRRASGVDSIAPQSDTWGNRGHRRRHSSGPCTVGLSSRQGMAGSLSTLASMPPTVVQVPVTVLSTPRISSMRSTSCSCASVTAWSHVMCLTRSPRSSIASLAEALSLVVVQCTRHSQWYHDSL